MEIFAPVFIALLLHSGIMRVFDAIQLHYVSRRVGDRVRDLLEQQREEDKTTYEEEVDAILRLLRGEKEDNKDNDPEGEWKYLDDGK